MFFAYDCKNQRVHINEAVARREYFCPFCGALLSQRKGKERRSHFAHMPKQICNDTWGSSYDMSDWHYDWQSQFPYSNQEVLISFGEVKHRADVLIGRTVVEFQHSFLSSKSFFERINFFYNLGYKVVWVFDVIEQYANGQIVYDDNKECFLWLRPKSTFNIYDIQSGQVELFFQLKENGDEPCLIKVSDISNDGIQEFKAYRWYTKTEFLQYLGVQNGVCKLPYREDVSENENYKNFREKYHIVLNKQQERVVQTIDGANLLLAVPGSGKTTVLVARLGFMVLCKNIPPCRILSMTYTKVATEDMRSRFASLFGDELAEQMEFRTINGIADVAIKKYAQKIGRRTFELLTDEKQKRSIIRCVLKKIEGEFPTENDIIDVETVISYIKNMQLSDEEISKLNVSGFDISEVYSLYREELVSKRLMDYDDQLIYACKILQKSPEILAWFHNKYHYICVDEAQDTSKVQHEIIRLLASKSNNIFMVGDEDQSIYGFRAAYPKALTNFKNDYLNPFVLYMERNYRSTVEIIDKAARFIENNHGRYKKQIVSDRGHGAPVQRIDVKNRADQYEYILEIARNITSETAVLYRDNDTAIPLIDLMLRKNVPFKAIKVKNLFFTNRVVMDIQAFLRFALDPYDVDSFMQIYYKCGFDFRKDMAQRACECSKRENISISNALIRQLKTDGRFKRKAAAFETFISDVGRQETRLAISTIHKRYRAYMRNNNLDLGKLELLSIMAISEPSIKAFLSRLNELHKIMAEEKTLGGEGIILSTIHSAKGLEYDSVYIADVYDGIFPNVDISRVNESIEIMDRYQEERRLFYVAMTRAKNNLTIVAIGNKSTSFVDEVMPNKKYDPHFTLQKITVRGFEKLEDSVRCGYNEVKERFTQQIEQIVDSRGRRWVKCEICGEIKMSSEFGSYGGINHVNLGVCSECDKLRNK